MATPVLVTAYGSASVTATSYFTATVTNAQAYAYPIDGYAFGVAEIESKLSTGTSTPTASPGSSAGAAAATYTVSTRLNHLSKQSLTCDRFWQVKTRLSHPTPLLRREETQ